MNDQQTPSPVDDVAEPSSAAPETNVLPLVALWALVVAVPGGYACGWALRLFYVLGTISLLLLGCIAGFVAARLIVRPSRLIGATLFVATAFAGAFAVTCWIHFEVPEGLESWLDAILWLPSYLKQESEFAAMAGGCAVVGAWCAYRQAARRPRRRPADQQ